LEVKKEKPILLVGGLEAAILAEAFRIRWQELHGESGVVREIEPGTQMSKADFISAMIKGRKL
jgi:hypothetical protein